MHTIRITLALFVLAMVAACTGTPTIEDKPSSEFPGLNKVSSSGFSEAWGRPGTTLSDYKSIRATSLKSSDAKIIQPGQSINTRVRKDIEMTPEIEAQLAQVWDTAITKAAKEQGLTADGNGDKVLRIDATMTRIAPSANFAEERNAPGRTTTYTEDSGEASIEIRLVDDASGELLAVVRDKRRVGSQVWSRSNTITASADVRNLFNNWAKRLTSRISGN